MAKSGSTPPDNDGADETRALLSAGAAARAARLSATDMVSTEEAAELAGESVATNTVWISSGRCIGLAGRQGFRLPRWQFDPNFSSLLPRLAAELGTTEGWALLSFLESPHGALEGESPRAVIERGQAERVFAIARHDGN